jgi:hypothetical protein
MPLNEPIRLLLKDSRIDNNKHAASPWGHGPLVGGTAIISHLFLTPFSIFISVIPIHSALLQHLGFAPLIDAFSLGSAIRI